MALCGRLVPIGHQIADNLGGLDLTVDIDNLMPYASGRERAKEGSDSARGPASAAAQGLAEWLKNDIQRGDGADVSQRLRQETQSILRWAKENGRLIKSKDFADLTDCAKAALRPPRILAPLGFQEGLFFGNAVMTV